MRPFSLVKALLLLMSINLDVERVYGLMFDLYVPRKEISLTRLLIANAKELYLEGIFWP